jgi:hypothetical protein
MDSRIPAAIVCLERIIVVEFRQLIVLHRLFVAKKTGVVAVVRKQTKTS